MKWQEDKYPGWVIHYTFWATQRNKIVVRAIRRLREAFAHFFHVLELPLLRNMSCTYTNTAAAPQSANIYQNCKYTPNLERCLSHFPPLSISCLWNGCNLLHQNYTHTQTQNDVRFALRNFLCTKWSIFFCINWFVCHSLFEWRKVLFRPREDAYVYIHTHTYSRSV